jgi:predicted RNase H-like HicB family nuclease
MRYPVAVEPATETTCFGVAVPDLPGCFSAGDTLDEAMTGAEESAAAWIDATLDVGDPVPPPSSLDAIRRNPDYAGWIFGLITVDAALLDDTVERVNITCRAVYSCVSMRWRGQREKPVPATSLIRSRWTSRVAYRFLNARAAIGQGSLGRVLPPGLDDDANVPNPVRLPCRRFHNDHDILPKQGKEVD